MNNTNNFYKFIDYRINRFKLIYYYLIYSIFIRNGYFDNKITKLLKSMFRYTKVPMKIIQDNVDYCDVNATLWHSHDFALFLRMKKDVEMNKESINIGNAFITLKMKFNLFKGTISLIWMNKQEFLFEDDFAKEIKKELTFREFNDYYGALCKIKYYQFRFKDIISDIYISKDPVQSKDSDELESITEITVKYYLGLDIMTYVCNWKDNVCKKKLKGAFITGETYKTTVQNCVDMIKEIMPKEFNANASIDSVKVSDKEKRIITVRTNDTVIAYIRSNNEINNFVLKAEENFLKLSMNDLYKLTLDGKNYTVYKPKIENNIMTVTEVTGDKSFMGNAFEIHKMK